MSWLPFAVFKTAIATETMMNCKNASRIVFKERAYPATGNSRVHYLKSGYIIQLIAFRWDEACICSSPDPSLSCGSGSGLRDYNKLCTQVLEILIDLCVTGSYHVHAFTAQI